VVWSSALSFTFIKLKDYLYRAGHRPRPREPKPIIKGNNVNRLWKNWILNRLKRPDRFFSLEKRWSLQIFQKEIIKIVLLFYRHQKYGVPPKAALHLQNILVSPFFQILSFENNRDNTTVEFFIQIYSLSIMIYVGQESISIVNFLFLFFFSPSLKKKVIKNNFFFLLLLTSPHISPPPPLALMRVMVQLQSSLSIIR